MNYRQKHSLTLTLTVASALCISLAAVADNPTSENVTRLLTKTKVLTQSFRVQCAGAHCNVVTYRNPKAAENDMKIDAILTAKAIRDVYPSIQSVTLQFYEGNLHNYQLIEVHAGDVRAFALGGLSKEQLLESLPVHKGTVGGGSTGGTSATSVSPQLVNNYQLVPGFNKAGRMHRLADLQEIQSKGGDISGLWSRFMTMEKVISDGGAEATTNDYNRFVPDVAQALQNANQEAGRIQEQSRLRSNQIISQSKGVEILPSLRHGYGYNRRVRLAVEIQRQSQLGLNGTNVQYYQSLLLNVIEPLCNSDDEVKADERMAQLEQQIGLSPWMGH